MSEQNPEQAKAVEASTSGATEPLRSEEECQEKRKQPEDLEEEEDFVGEDNVIVLEDPDNGEEDTTEVEDKSDSIFINHTDNVYCVSFRKQRLSDGSIVFASGGGDDKGVLFHVKPNSEEFKAFDLSGHTDSINRVAFSADGTLLATAGLDGLVNVWNPEDGKLITTISGPASIEWIQFHPSLPALLVGDKAGMTWMFNAQTAKCAKVYSCHVGPVTCGGFRSDGSEMWTAGEDMILRIWAIRSGQTTNHQHGIGFHSVPILAGACNPNGALIATGDESGIVKVTRFDDVKVLGSIDAGNNTIEAITFSPDNKFIAVASMGGTASIWNAIDFTMRQTLAHPAGVTSIKFHPTQPCILVTGCSDGAIRVWDIRDGNLLDTLTGNEGVINDLDVRPVDDKPTDLLILTASDDATVRLFSYVHKSEPINVIPPPQ